MGRALSLDLRERVTAAVAGGELWVNLGDDGLREAAYRGG